MIYFKNVPQYGDLEIEKVLFLFDNIPMIFVYRDDKKRYFLCQCVDVIDKFSWMITPVQKRLLISMVEDEISVLSAFNEYYGAAEPPVRCGESHLSGLTEPLRSL